MEILTITFLVISLFFFFIYTVKWNRSSMTMHMVVPKLPPSPSKLPIIGNLHHLIGKPRHQALWQLSQQFGPIMLLHIGAKPYLVISSSSLAKQILKTQDHIFCSRPMTHATKRLTYNYLDIAFSPYSDHWRQMRKLLVSEFLGPKRARLFRHVLVTQITDMVRSISLYPSNNVVNLSSLFIEVVKGVVCKVAFGKNYREQPIKGPSWEVMIDETMETLNGSLGDSFPWLGQVIDRFSGWNYKLEKCFSNLDAYIDTILEDHHNHTVSDDDKDFVHALLELSSIENASDNQLTKDDIKALVMDVLTGGVDSTVVTMVWAMSEITRNARVMQKLQHEIRTCTGGNKKVDELDITKMTYLKMVVKETLRLHPAAPLLVPHESLTHCQLDGYDVLPGTTVLVNGWGIGRDPSTWGENACEFYPERFENNLEVDFEMVPFGGGRRSCPAMNSAPTTIEFTIANLLYWFDWEVVEDLDMLEEGSLILRKKLPLCVNVPKKHDWDLKEE